MKNFLIVFCLWCSVFSSAQQTEYVDFEKVKADISFSPDSSLVKGGMVVDFVVKKAVDTVVIDAKNIISLANGVISYTNVSYKGKRLKGIDNVADFNIKINYNKNKIFLIYDFKERGYSISFDYISKPKKNTILFETI